MEKKIYIFISEKRKEALFLTKIENNDFIKRCEASTLHMFGDLKIIIKKEIKEGKQWERSICLDEKGNKQVTQHLQNLVCSCGTIKESDYL